MFQNFILKKKLKILFGLLKDQKLFYIINDLGCGIKKT